MLTFVRLRPNRCHPVRLKRSTFGRTSAAEKVPRRSRAAFSWLLRLELAAAGPASRWEAVHGRGSSHQVLQPRHDPTAPLTLIHFGGKWQRQWVTAAVTLAAQILLIPYEERAMPHGHWASSRNTIPAPSPHHLSTIWTCQAAWDTGLEHSVLLRCRPCCRWPTFLIFTSFRLCFWPADPPVANSDCKHMTFSIEVFGLRWILRVSIDKTSTDETFQ